MKLSLGIISSFALAAVAGNLVACSGSHSDDAIVTGEDLSNLNAPGAIDWSNTRALTYSTKIYGVRAGAKYTKAIEWHLNVDGGAATFPDPGELFAHHIPGIAPVTQPMLDTGDIHHINGDLADETLMFLESMPGKNGGLLAVGKRWTTKYPSDAEVAAIDAPAKNTIVWQRTRNLEITRLFRNATTGDVTAHVEVDHLDQRVKTPFSAVPGPVNPRAFCTYDVDVTRGVVLDYFCDVAFTGNTATVTRHIATSGDHVTRCGMLIEAERSGQPEPISAAAGFCNSVPSH